MSGQKEKPEDRTGTYGGDDGAMKDERAETESGEETGIAATPHSKSQAERKQDKDLETGEENPA